MADDLTRASLLVRIRKPEDETAWMEFVDLYGPLIVNFCRKRGVADHDIEDISQEVLVAVASAIRNFEYDPDKGTFRSWIYRFVRNRLSRHFRWKQRHPDRGSGRTTVQQVIESQKSPDDEKFEKEWDREYQARLFAWASEKVKQEIAPQTWKAFHLVAVENLSVDEVAKQLNIKTGAVYVAKSRVISRLRETIEAVSDGWDPDMELPT